MKELIPLLTLALVLVPTTAATQTTRFCEGREATIVGTAGDDSIEQGLDGDDVYIMLGGYD